MQNKILPFELPLFMEIGLRYVSAKRKSVGKRRDGFLSFISTLSMVGIALGVASLIIVLSVMNGFQKEVRDKMLSVLSHVEIRSQGGIENWQEMATFLSKQNHIIGVSPILYTQGLIIRNGMMRGMELRGIEPDTEKLVSEIPAQISGGAIALIQPGAFNIALGVELAQSLGVQKGDRISVMVPQGDLTPAGVLPRQKSFTVVGLIDSGHFEYDSSLAVIHWKDAAALTQNRFPTGLRVKLDNMYLAPEVSSNLNGALPPGMVAMDWSMQNRTWFAAVKTEKRMMFIILAMIIAVAAFNLVSTLVMTVTDKQADIAILRTMGASARMIQKIFFVQGMAIGILGSIFGVLLGLLVATNIDVIVPAIESLFGVHFLPKDIYFISELPSDVHLEDVVKVGGMAFILSLLATLYPSYRAAKVKPAEALRYE
ncbi:lipoprotein releasing system protein [Polynucleobacter sp. SHI8]|uniref:lipoprotein-releasing ABC transporter permease subunit n=1 Tax=unclassified Polynucleobacter TaxID=2640945 RepID=UPI0024911829|nr:MULTISPECIES: lipoprotein-releasing ABC transporter permease subunit [unclassified Polynucleobacter]BDW10802.1 lipoprotein releasing system protein [Polynucleobacter sp. SHI2]BDW13248.1 lipoprotein releasing system protein [Polynucleobacter sp. SHI8]